MVIKGKHLIYAACIILFLLLAGFAVWYILKPGEEQLIRRHFANLVEQINKTPLKKEGAIPAMAKAQKIAAMFTEQSQFNVDALKWVSGSFSREVLANNIFRSRAMFDTLHLSLDHLEIEVAEDQKQAVARLSAQLSGKMKNSGQDLEEIRDLECNLKKIDSEWLFESFRIHKMIKK